MERMDGVMEYIRPELLVLVAVLYIVGKALKASQDVKDKHIPLILGGAGVFLAMLVSQCLQTAIMFYVLLYRDWARFAMRARHHHDNR